MQGTKDPPVTVHGSTPSHAVSRIIAVSADGRVAVFDVYNGRVVHEEAPPFAMRCTAAHITRDGTKVCLIAQPEQAADAGASGGNAVLLAPTASLRSVSQCSVLVSVLAWHAFVAVIKHVVGG
jgi:hypothetical protein